MWRFRRRRRGGLLGLLLFIIIIAAIVFFLNGCTPGNSSSLASSENNTSQVTQYYVHYDFNGYLAYDAPASQTLAPGSLVTEPTPEKRPGYTLEGWSLAPSADPVVYWDFANDTLDSSITLYAVWTQDVYTIHFDMNGGSGTAPADQTLTFLETDSSGLTNKVVRPSSVGLFNGGFTLNGWWLKDNLGAFIQEWNFESDLPSKDMTLYAGWGTAGLEGHFYFMEYETAIKITDYSDSDYLDAPLLIPDLINGKPVLSIGEEAFASYYNAPNIILPAFLTTINTKAFYDCESVYELTIPDSVTSIGKMAFDSCGTIYTLDLGSGVTNIGEMAFYGSENLGVNSDPIVIPSNVLSIEKFAFSITGGDALKQIEFENGLIYIGEEAFSYGNMTTIDLPDSVETIGRKAFAYCYDLADIYIGRGITLILDDAFRYADQNTWNYLHVYIDAVVPPVLGNSVVFGPWQSSGTDSRTGLWFVVPEASIPAYETAENWSVYYSTRIVSFLWS